MIQLYLLPGDLISRAVGLQHEGPNRQALRSFFQMMIWGVFNCAVAVEGAATLPRRH